MQRTAAIVTIGSELTMGLRLDTNTAEIARALTPFGFTVMETVSVADSVQLLASELTRLVSQRDLVITTGGLGPTHDDITREAAAHALGVTLEVDSRLVEWLGPIQKRHRDPLAAQQVLEQAKVIPGARVIDATTGTAPGQIAQTPRGRLALLPGPPSEMRPMLADVLADYEVVRGYTRELGVVGMPESDVQVLVQRAMGDTSGIGFTVLAKPGDVRVLLSDEGAGEATLDEVASDVIVALDDNCYSTDGSSLAATVVALARLQGVTLTCAESCTGGMVSAALTDVPGASLVFAGGVVSYSNRAKSDLLAVDPGTLIEHGAVSSPTVRAMAAGALNAFEDAHLAVSISGVAGPDGGTADKPVGTVWFGVASSTHVLAQADHHEFVRSLGSGSRDAIRARATSIALDCMRRALLGLPLPR